MHGVLVYDMLSKNELDWGHNYTSFITCFLNVSVCMIGQ